MEQDRRVSEVWNRYKQGTLTDQQVLVLIGAMVRENDWGVPEFKKRFGVAYKFCKEHELVFEYQDPESKNKFVRLSPDFRPILQSLESSTILESIPNNLESSSSILDSSKSKSKKGTKNAKTPSSATKTSNDAKKEQHAQRKDEIEADPVFQRVYEALTPYFNAKNISAWRLAQGVKGRPYKHYELMCAHDEDGIDWATYAEWYRDEGPFQDKGFQWALFLSDAVVSQFQSVQEGREYAKSKKDRYLKTTSNLKNNKAWDEKVRAFKEGLNSGVSK